MVKTQFTNDQYLVLRSMIAEHHGIQDWNRASKRRRSKIVRQAFDEFYKSVWWSRMLLEVPPCEDGYWRPLLTNEDEKRMTAELAELVARMRAAMDAPPHEKLELMEAMYRLLRRMNHKDPFADD